VNTCASLQQRHLQPRSAREENAEIKAGRLLAGWDENPERLRKKDLDARCVKKTSINHYGYKNIISIDVDRELSVETL